MEEGNKAKKSFLQRLFFKKEEAENEVGKGNKIKLIIAGVLMVIVIIIFASSFKTTSSKTASSEEKSITNLSAMEYCEVLENRLVNVLKNIKGIGNVEVFIMVDSSPTIKFLEETNTTQSKNDQTTSQSVQTTIVMAKEGTITSPVVTIELLPKITGVLIVATGAKDVKLKTTLINATASILSVNISNVEVLEGK